MSVCMYTLGWLISNGEKKILKVVALNPSISLNNLKNILTKFYLNLNNYVSVAT